MESRDDGAEKPQAKGCVRQEEETTAESSRGKKAKVQREEDSNSERESPNVKLSKKTLLQLLGIMEGEVQAREDVIRLLRTERGGPEKLASRYGRALPADTLRSLQRDDCVFPRRRPAGDVYEKPMAELERLEDKQRETYRRMLEQLLLAEKCHRRTVAELDSEKSKHADFMAKSDDFTNLLEQERESLKKLLEQEEARRARKDSEHDRRLGKLRARLLELKSLALTLAAERRLNAERLDLRSRKVRELTGELRDKERRLAEVGAAAERDGRRALRLEAELERRAATSKLQQEGSAAKLSQQESQNRRLRAQLSALAGQMEELRRSDARQADKDPPDLRDHVGEGPRADSRLAARPEALRKTPAETEGEDEEGTEAEARRRELGARPRYRENGGRELGLRPHRPQRRTADLEKPEGAERLRLRAKPEEEKQAAGRADAEPEELRRPLGEPESERTEIALKDELAQLKSLAVTLADDRTNAAERLKARGEKREESTRRLKDEGGEATRVAEKPIDGSKKLLRSKSDTEVRAARAGEENGVSKGQLGREQERRRRLDADARQMQAATEEARETRQSRAAPIKEPALARETLRSRLAPPEVVEGDLIKTEDRYQAPETQCRTREERPNSLTDALEEMTRRTRQRAKAEEAESPHPEAPVQALKGKIQQPLPKEDRLSLSQDHDSRLQQRFREKEEGRAKSLAREAANLGQELQAGPRRGRAPRPGTADAQLASAAALLGASARDFLRPSAAAEPEAPEASVSPKPGRALRIRLTPDPSDGSATLEIFPTPGVRRPRITIVPRAGAVAAKGQADPARSPVTITAVCRAASLDGSDGRPAPPSAVSTRPTAAVAPRTRARAAAGPVFSGDVITTEDKKIDIRPSAAADERDGDGEPRAAK